MARVLAVVLLVWPLVWTPAWADTAAPPVLDRTASIKQRLDAARPNGRALEQSVRKNLRTLRDLSRRAEAAGVTLPPVVLKGAAAVRTRPRIGFGRSQIVSLVRPSLLLMPRTIITSFESRDASEGQKEFTPYDGMRPMITKLGRFFPERAALKTLVAAGVTAKDVDQAFQLWSLEVDLGLAIRQALGPGDKLLEPGKALAPAKALEPAKVVEPVKVVEPAKALQPH